MNVEINDETDGSDGSDGADGVDEVDAEHLMRLFRFAMGELRLHPACELSVKLVDADTMAGYHQQFLGLPGPTDVMSWPMDELRPGEPGGRSDPGHLGDIAICPQVAAEQADKAGHSTQTEVDLLCVHGLLHLLGYDHAEPADKQAMWDIQTKLLTAWAEQSDGSGDAGERQGAGR